MKTCLCFVLTFAVCYAAVYLERPNEKAGDGYCLSKYTDVGLMKYGEVKSVSGKCQSAKCKSNGSIQYFSCGVQIFDDVPDNCQVVEPYLNSPYPTCCKKEVVCDEKNLV